MNSDERLEILKRFSPLHAIPKSARAFAIVDLASFENGSTMRVTQRREKLRESVLR